LKKTPAKKAAAAKEGPLPLRRAVLHDQNIDLQVRSEHIAYSALQAAKHFRANRLNVHFFAI
jgi:hypothetical protein